MKQGRGAILFSAVFLLFTCTALAVGEMLTNEKVEAMAQAELGESLIIAKIRSSKNTFDVSTEEIMRLKQIGLSERIIESMIEMSSTTGRQPSIGAADSSTAEYDEALRLCAEHKYGEAIQIFNRLIRSNTDIKYQFAFADAMIEQSWNMKLAYDQNWETMALRAQAMLKTMYREHNTNPDYWILYSKFGGIDRNTRDISGGFKKAFYYKPGYLKALLEQGRIYHRLAGLVDEKDVFQMDSGRSSNRQEKRHLAKVARKAYLTALISPEITGEQKAAVYYNLGELEREIFKNKKEAANHWGKSVETYADSKWGMLSQERLNSRE